METLASLRRQGSLAFQLRFDLKVNYPTFPQATKAQTCDKSPHVCSRVAR